MREQQKDSRDIYKEKTNIQEIVVKQGKIRQIHSNKKKSKTDKRSRLKKYQKEETKTQEQEDRCKSKKIQDTTKRQEKKGTPRSNKRKREQQGKAERITGRHRERALCTLEDPSCVRPSRVLSSRREKRRNSHQQRVGEHGGATRRDLNSIREFREREIEQASGRASDRQGKIHAAKPPCVSILRRRSKEKGVDRDGKREADTPATVRKITTI